ncbi:MAG: oxidoreductase [Gammaproteobacteria bacterium]|nr:oxidoreductase [Gammaproteobacteria bacterium]
MSPFVGLIGFGYWGKNILRNLCELGVLYTACDSNQNLILEQKKAFPSINFTSSFDEVLQNKDIKAIAISTPAATHANFVKQSLLAGKDVFVEKPLALTAKEGQKLTELAEKENRILMVGHILQYHPAVLKLKELLSSGEIGKIQYIYSNRLNIGKLRTEENILWSFAPHDISVILMLLEEEPIRVSAFGEDCFNRRVYDTTMTSMEFGSGVKGHVFVSWLHPYKEQKLIVVGSKAMIVFDDLNQDKLRIYPHKIEWKGGKIPVAYKAAYKVIPVEDTEPLKQELKHFIECVEKKKTPRTDGIEGVKVLKVLERAEESLSHKVRQGFGMAQPDKNVTSSPSTSLEAGLSKDHSRSPFNLSKLVDGSQSKIFFAHESSFIDEDVKIGEGTKIWHFSHILKGSKIGNRCIIGQNVMIGSDVKIGDKCKLQNNVSVYTGVILEDGVFCGPSCVFTNVYNPRAFIERKDEFLQTLIKKGATIGANATIICGVTIGKYAMIGAGAVIKTDVLDYAVVAGVPAKQIGWTCQCGTTLKISNNNALCKYCGNKYMLKNGKAIEVLSK